MAVILKFLFIAFDSFTAHSFHVIKENYSWCSTLVIHTEKSSGDILIFKFIDACSVLIVPGGNLLNKRFLVKSCSRHEAVCFTLCLILERSSEQWICSKLLRYIHLEKKILAHLKIFAHISFFHFLKRQSGNNTSPYRYYFV